MASFTQHKSKNTGKSAGRIHFTLDGKRRTFYLGTISGKNGRSFLAKIEELIAHKTTGFAWPVELSSWVRDLESSMAKKLAGFGLIPTELQRVRRAPITLEKFVNNYIGSRDSLKPYTIRNLRQARDKLLSRFGKDRAVMTITVQEIKDWVEAMRAKGGAPASLGGTIKKAKQFFGAMVNSELLTKNPMAGIKAPKQSNDSRNEFVSREVIYTVLEACPTNEWKLLVALARFGGMRVPTETSLLKWQDIDWKQVTMLVTSPKTARHAGGGSRTVPLFTELRPYLDAVRKEAADDAVYVI